MDVAYQVIGVVWFGKLQGLLQFITLIKPWTRIIQQSAKLIMKNLRKELPQNFVFLFGKSPEGEQIYMCNACAPCNMIALLRSKKIQSQDHSYTYQWHLGLLAAGWFLEDEQSRCSPSRPSPCCFTCTFFSSGNVGIGNEKRGWWGFLRSKRLSRGFWYHRVYLFIHRLVSLSRVWSLVER